jgi:hypothetical protein
MVYVHMILAALPTILPHMGAITLEAEFITALQYIQTHSFINPYQKTSIHQTEVSKGFQTLYTKIHC